MMVLTDEQLNDLALYFLDDDSKWGKLVNTLIGNYADLKLHNKQTEQRLASIATHAEFILDKTWSYKFAENELQSKEGVQS